MPSGACLCGAVSFEVAGELKAPDHYYDIADGLPQHER